MLFDQGAANQLFPPANRGLPDFVRLLNSSLNAMTANKKAGCMLQVSQDIGETLLYRGNQQNTASSLGPFNLVAERSLSGIIPLVEETAVFRTKRHAEVFIKI